MLRYLHLFANYIYTRGYDYYRDGRVTPTSVQNGTYLADVRGGDFYTVRIETDGPSIRKMDCTCQYARKGYNCKHMAAVCIAIVNGDFASVRPRRRLLLSPFHKEGTQYRYFDLETITSGLMIDSDAYERAAALVSDGAKIERFEKGYLTEATRSAQCAELFALVPEKGETHRTHLLFSPERIRGMECTCMTERSRFLYSVELPPLCDHLLATLILTDRYIEEHNPGDTTDYGGFTLMKRMREQRRQARGETQNETARERVRLEPTLTMGLDELCVRFRVGTDKLYVLKELRDLTDAVKGRAALSLGKKTSLDFSRARFDDESAALFSIIRQYEADRAALDVLAFDGFEHTRFGRELPLYGAVLDRFFDLYLNKTLPLLSGKNTDEVRFCEGAPALTLRLTPTLHPTGGLIGLRLQGSLPRLLSGAAHRYAMSPGHFYRLTEAFYQAIYPLFDAAGESGRLELNIGRELVPEFYYTVLPQLRPYAEILLPEDGAWEALLPPEARFLFYLDYAEGLLRCRAAVCYGETELALDAQASAGTMRDRVREEEALSAVTALFPTREEETGEYLCEATEDAVFRLLGSGVDLLLSLGEVHATDRFNALRIRRRVRVNVGVAVQSRLLDLSVSSPDVTKEEIAGILESYRAKKRYHRLRSGEFVSFDETVEELDALFSALQISPRDFARGKMHIPAYRSLYLEKTLENSDRLQVTRDRMFRKIVKDFSTVKEADYEPPQSLSGVLRGYQVYGHKWLRTLEGLGFHGILADDMGLGKTLQVISVLLAAKEAGAPCSALVVCPASLVYNWAEEFARFAPALGVSVIAGGGDERRRLLQTTKAEVLITSYDLLKRDVLAYEGRAFRYQIIDEAQYIKNHATEAAKSVKLIKSEVRFALTGTPIENRLSELWSIFDYLMPGYLYSYENFRRTFELPIAHRQDAAAMARLKAMVSPFILRRLKQEVLAELPEKLEEVCFARFAPEQQRLYDAAVLRLKASLEARSEEDFSKNKIQILAELTRLRRLCCDPRLLYEDYPAPGAKSEACMQLIASAVEGGHKLLLFSQFTSMLALLETELRGRGIPYYLLTGETPKSRRVDLVKAFNNNDVPVFLISLKAGGTGLNLTGADVVIHFDPWWNTAVEQQATDRAHRIGQTNVVTVYKLIAKDTIEDRIVELQQTKQALADAVLAGDGSGISEMTKEELLQLLS